MSAPAPRRMLCVSLLVVLSLPLGTSAFAYWTGTGTGSGDSATDAGGALILSPGTPTGVLLPGGTADVVLTVSNPNASPVQVSSLSLDLAQGASGFAVDAGHSGCNESTLSFTTDTNGGAGWTVPAKIGAVNGTLPVTLANALAMGPDAANACQGASATIYLAAS